MKVVAIAIIAAVAVVVFVVGVYYGLSQMPPSLAGPVEPALANAIGGR